MTIVNHKSQITNHKQSLNSKSKIYDLEQRTFIFAKNCRQLIKELPKSTINIEDGRQLTRSSGSVGANYIEANEALSKKDFLMRIKICRKEAKESRYWLELLNESSKFKPKITVLTGEATELIKIFSSILEKSQWLDYWILRIGICLLFGAWVLVN